MSELHGKVAVVLGASAKGGTGWGIAEGLAARGAKVVVAARTFAPLQELATAIGGSAFCCDGGTEADIRALKDHILNIYGALDIAVNSAATPTLGMIADADEALLRQGVQVNYFGHVYFVRYMAEAMRGPGSITLISSMSATHPIAPHFAYACGKAAMECLIRYAALEYAPRQIRVNGIRIATVYSEMARAHYETPGIAERFIHEIPLGRLGMPADMADAAAWLAGAGYVTGAILDIAGGNQMTRFPYLRELPGQGASYEGTGALYDRAQGQAAKFSGLGSEAPGSKAE